MCETPVTKTKTVKIFFRTVNDSNWLDLPGLCNINSKFSQNSAKIPIQNKPRICCFSKDLRKCKLSQLF